MTLKFAEDCDITKKTNWRFLIVHKSDKGNPARKKKSHGNPYRTAPAGRKAGRSLYRHDAGHSVSGPGAAERYGLDHPPCRRRHIFSPKRLSSRAGLCGSRRVGRRPVRRRPYYLSAQNTRKGNRHRTPENLSFGMTACAGLAGAVIGILQIVIYTGASPAPVWIVIGGLLNFASGLPIYCSFKKGIFYGVQ